MVFAQVRETQDHGKGAAVPPGLPRETPRPTSMLQELLTLGTAKFTRSRTGYVIALTAGVGVASCLMSHHSFAVYCRASFRS